VGVVTVHDQHRVRTVFTEAWEAAARGATSAELPAFRFQPPADDSLAGFQSQMAHWNWTDPPPLSVPAPIVVEHPKETVMPHPVPHQPVAAKSAAAPAAVPDLVVVSHLRWTWVWQRPQHLVSRFADWRAKHGARTWFVEEPTTGPVERPELRTEDRDGVTRVWLIVPGDPVDMDRLSFDDPQADTYPTMVADC
jgi:hypothetical protein